MKRIAIATAASIGLFTLLAGSAAAQGKSGGGGLGSGSGRGGGGGGGKSGTGAAASGRSGSVSGGIMGAGFSGVASSAGKGDGGSAGAGRDVKGSGSGSAVGRAGGGKSGTGPAAGGKGASGAGSRNWTALGVMRRENTAENAANGSQQESSNHPENEDGPTGRDDRADHGAEGAAVQTKQPMPFRENPTVVAVTSGRWSDDATWSEHVPSDSDQVLIPAGVEVVIDDESAEAAELLVRGRLTFQPDQSTRLTVRKLFFDFPQKRTDEPSGVAPAATK